MAPKRPLPSADPPPASSSDEEESSGASDDEETEEEKEEGRESGESESKSESDEEDNKGRQEGPSQPKPSSLPPPPQQQQQQQQKSQGGSSSTESELRRDTVKPIASKPMEKIETPPTKKQRPEPSSTSKQPSAKRKVELEGSKEPKESKRGKKNVAENGSVQKSGKESKKSMVSKANGAIKSSQSAATSKVVTAPKPKSETSLERPKEMSCDEMLQISRIGLDENFLKKGWEMVDESRKEEWNERWRKLQLTEMRVSAEITTLIRDQINHVLEAYEHTTRR